MIRGIDSLIRRHRISIDVEPEFRRRLGLAAARRHVTVRRYVPEATEARLRHDANDDYAAPAALTTASDPVLAELWDNEHDAAYDRL